MVMHILLGHCDPQHAAGQAVPAWHGSLEEVQTNPNTWPWAALASIMLLHELLAGKGWGVAYTQVLYNTDLVQMQVCRLGSICPV